MNDEQYMRLALREAAIAFEKDEVPIGAVLVIGDKIISRSYNQVELLNDSTAHAEILSLTAAYNSLGSKYVNNATLYVTIEPCLMCCGALYWSKIGKVVFGAPDDKNSFRKYTGDINPFHPKTILIAGVLREECGALMKEFFTKKRKL